MTSCRKVIHESIETLKSITLLQIMLSLLKTNHTCIGHGPNCNLKFVKKFFFRLQVFFFFFSFFVRVSTYGVHS